ncbi:MULTISPECIES: FtsB family cell division protein [unclassified Nannocystis]|uniref:FtsB family cell division protein n=1 Tax=Nannocystis TaxID=53 RepID=UPI0022718E03|nr:MULTISPECIES: septum formation initiator family protein [unclassified Nannocystis]MCY0991555.1 septum formation initiator family protein [Nannocystis sp. ILAH1]MCY1066603.1 septum formation initiator family protein [Nannocystis sp. RBIL2]
MPRSITPAKVGQFPMQWVNRILLAALLAFAIAYLPQHVATGGSAEDLARVEKEHAALRRGNERLQGEIEALRAEIAALKRDPEEVARIAREDLNLIRPGEVVFEIRRDDKTKP